MNSTHTRHRIFRRPLERAAARFFEARGVPTTSPGGFIPRCSGTRTAPAARGQPITPQPWHVNLIDDEVIGAIEGWRHDATQAGRNIALHDYLHHGLSSQAMAFNLIGHLIARDDIDAMGTAFVAAGAPWPGAGARATLEHEDPSVFDEKQRQPTSIDLVIEPAIVDAGPTLFVEVKLVESGFGGCSQLRARGERPAACSGANPLLLAGELTKACRLARIGRTYWKRLEEQGVLGATQQTAPRCPLADDYQFFREVGFALHRSGHFVLLVDARNPAFVTQPGESIERGAWDRLIEQVQPAARKRMHLVTLQSVVAAIRGTGRHGDWIERFVEKYALDDPIGSGSGATPLSHSSPVSDSFSSSVLRTVRAHLRHSGLRVPTKVGWSLEVDPDGVQVVQAAMTFAQLNRNLQTDEAAAPTFAICLAHWLESDLGTPVRARVRMLDEAPVDLFGGATWQHLRRSLLVLDAYQQAFPHRFSVHGGATWRWPHAPQLNAATAARSRKASAKKAIGSEHHLEVAFANDPEVRATFSRLVEPIGPIDRQLPAGLFDGQVAEATAWTPGKASQVDAWAVSSDGRTLHLFELKITGNVKLGILPEAISYAWLLRHAGVAPPDGTQVRGSGAALAQIAETERVVVWLTTPRLHPLLGPSPQGASPLDALNRGLAPFGVSVGVLPIEFDLAVGVTMRAPWGGSGRADKDSTTATVKA